MADIIDRVEDACWAWPGCAVAGAGPSSPKVLLAGTNQVGRELPHTIFLIAQAIGLEMIQLHAAQPQQERPAAGGQCWERDGPIQVRAVALCKSR